MERYARITEKFPREFLLLQGTGCFHKVCRFCDYYCDVSSNHIDINKPVIEKVTGEFGVLDVINSGSVHELDESTLNLLSRVAHEKDIKTIWFEAHCAYADRLEEIRERFPGVDVRFRTGVESFSHSFRVSMNKGMPDITPEEIRRSFDGVCLLICIEGQTKESITEDIEIAEKLFDYYSVNVFCPNSTDVKLDQDLYYWFLTEHYPKIKNRQKAEILLLNTDLGVGVL